MCEFCSISIEEREERRMGRVVQLCSRRLLIKRRYHSSSVGLYESSLGIKNVQGWITEILIRKPYAHLYKYCGFNVQHYNYRSISSTLLNSGEHWRVFWERGTMKLWDCNIWSCTSSTILSSFRGEPYIIYNKYVYRTEFSANLSDSYFTDRQDRYVMIENSKKLVDFFCSSWFKKSTIFVWWCTCSYHGSGISLVPIKWRWREETAFGLHQTPFPR